MSHGIQSYYIVLVCLVNNNIIHIPTCVPLVNSSSMLGSEVPNHGGSIPMILQFS